MGYDKAVDSAKLDADILSIADAIRTKGGTDAPLNFPAEFVSAIQAIQAGGGDLYDAYKNLTLRAGGKPYEIINNDTKFIATTAFERSNNCKKISFPKVTATQFAAFQLCANLEEIDMPKTKNVALACFSGCSKLQKVDFQSAEAFGNNCFTHCKKLETLIIRVNQRAELENAGAFNDTPIASGTGYIYVPKALVEQYKAAPNWSVYAAQIRAIEDYPEITGGAK